VTTQIELDDETDRYHRQSLISWWDQERLANAKVLIVGAGALGNELIKNLALVGVGSIVIVDRDSVENSNLARCILFRAEDEGKPKAPLAAERAMEINPDVGAVGLAGDVRHAVGLGTFIDADLVLGGLDNREARLFLNAACWKTGTPWIDGAIEGLMGVMRAFVPPDSADYESTMSRDEHELLARRRACTLLTQEELESGRVPTTATTASVIAGLQAQEAIKLLHRDRVESDFGGKGFVYNGLNHDSYVVTYTTREDALTRDSYELESLTTAPGDVTFGELLERAKATMGDDAHLLLEHEIVRAFSCSPCGSRQEVNRPTSALPSGAALCPKCGAERRLELVHRVASGDADLTALGPADLDMPPAEVVTATTGSERRFFLVDPDASPFRSDG
jgi:molybdopterin/thiamine biosynthesis adenylyltransferase